MRKLISALIRTGAGSIGTLAFGAAAVKIMALLLGPAGVGLFSLLRQSQQTLSMLGSFGGQTALIQGIASREGEDRTRFVLTSSIFFIAGIALVSVALVLLSQPIATALFGREKLAGAEMVQWLAVPSSIGILVAFFTGILNGHKAISSVAWIQVVAAIILALSAYPLSVRARSGKELSLLWLLALSLAGSAVYGLLVCIRHGWLGFTPRTLLSMWHPESAKAFKSIGGTTLLTGLIGTGVALVLRAMVVRHNGLSAAGLFDVAWTLSMMYVLIILNSFNTYYLPTLSGTFDAAARVQLLNLVLRVAIMAMVPLITAVIVFKPLVISLLYSHEFVASLRMMRWMLLGDYLKITSWVLGIPMVAFADTRSFFWSELIAGGMLVLLAAGFLDRFDSLEGVGLSFVLVYLAYLVYVIHYVRNQLHVTFPRKTVLYWGGGLVVVVCASAHTWSKIQFDWKVALVWCVVALAFSLGMLEPAEIEGLKQQFNRCLRR